MLDNSIKIFKMLSDENRLRIFHMLRERELCACDLQEGLNLTQSGLSYHMKIMTDTGLILKRPEGNWIHYRLNEDYSEIIDLIENVVSKDLSHQ